MRRALVIADDLSGAAEIAGIGLRFGLATKLVLDRVHSYSDGLTVIDADSRSLDPADASARVARLINSVDPRQFDLIYKKTDSAMRGNILAEVSTIAGAFHLGGALLVPQNPSRGRTIIDGEYRINGVLLHETSFAGDPDHPASCSDAITLLGRSPGVSVRPPLGPVDLRDITIGCAANAGEVRFWANQLNPRILPAGGADFFTAILESRGLRPVQPFVTAMPAGRDVFVCGSASANHDALIAGFGHRGFAICAMPDDVFSGGDGAAWHREVAEITERGPRTLVMIPQPLDRQQDRSTKLQQAMGDLVAAVVGSGRVEHLFLEGGATASAVCRRLGWTHLDVAGELATGVVQLRIRGRETPEIFIKPGSYPWPGWLLAQR